METEEEKLERKKIVKRRLFYLFICLDILFGAFLIFEVIYAIH